MNKGSQNCRMVGLVRDLFQQPAQEGQPRTSCQTMSNWLLCVSRGGDLTWVTCDSACLPSHVFPAVKREPPVFQSVSIALSSCLSSLHPLLGIFAH